MYRKNIYNGIYVASNDFFMGCVEVTETKIRNVYRKNASGSTIATCKTRFYWR